MQPARSARNRYIRERELTPAHRYIPFHIQQDSLGYGLVVFPDWIAFMEFNAQYPHYFMDCEVDEHDPLIYLGKIQ